MKIDPDKYLQINEHYIPFSAILDEMHLQFLKIERKPNHCYHLFLLGVSPSHRGLKIGRTLVELSEHVAINHLFDYVLIEGTSPDTLPICQQMNYINIDTLGYQDYVLNNHKPFEDISDYNGPQLFLKKIGNE